MLDTDLLTIFGMLGQTGAGMVKRTDKEWVGAPGLVAANTAKNVQAGMANKEFTDLLRAIADQNVKGASIKLDPATGKPVGVSVQGDVVKAGMPTYPAIPTTPQATPQAQAAPAPPPSTIEATSPVSVTNALNPAVRSTYMDDTQRAMMSSMLAQGGGPSPFPWARSLWQYRG